MKRKRCKCNHNQPCAEHPGFAGWLRRFREYFLFLRFSGGHWWLQTPFAGCAWNGFDDPSVRFCVSFWPASWRLIVPPGGCFYRFSIRFHAFTDGTETDKAI